MLINLAIDEIIKILPPETELTQEQIEEIRQVFKNYNIAIYDKICHEIF